MWLLFPNQLFPLEYLKDGDKKAVLAEDPLFFGSTERVEMFSKGKLVFHRASMKHYAHELKSAGFEVNYLDFKQLPQAYTFKEQVIHVWNPTDHLLKDQLTQRFNMLVFHTTPCFLFPPVEVITYAKDWLKTHDTFQHNHFYKWSKEQLGILEDVPSYDKENRQDYPKDQVFPPLPENDNDTKWVKEAQKYVQQTFPDNYGTVDLIFPITRKTSREWWFDFETNRFPLFGKYQDAISKNNEFGFHSLISPMLNAGLLTPDWVLDRLRKLERDSNSVDIASFEAFVRQLIGWREYSRMLYLTVYEEMQQNYFEHKAKPTQAWYKGTLGLLPVDKTIRAGFQNAYLHHILRLMMMSNMFNLVGIHPDYVYQWFMEFSADSYDWVMISNVYSMGMWADGGLTMRKPYLSSSNYILKMSDYPPGPWVDLWKALFYHFLWKQKEKLRRTPYIRNLRYFESLPQEEQDTMIQTAQTFISKVTK